MQSTFTITAASRILNRNRGTIWHWLHEELGAFPVKKTGRILHYDLALFPQLEGLAKARKPHIVPPKAKTEVAPWIQRQPEIKPFQLDAEPVAHDVEPVQQTLQLLEPIKETANDKLAEAVMALAREVRQLAVAVKQRRI